jgi:hypothetical protein
MRVEHGMVGVDPCGFSRGIGGEPFSHRVGERIFGENRKASTHARCATPAVGNPSFGETRKVSVHARRGTPPRALDEGYVADLYPGVEWPKVSAVAETRAETRMRTAKIWNHDLGESLKQGGKSGAIGAAKSQPATLERSAQDCQYDSGECLKTDPYMYCLKQGGKSGAIGAAKSQPATLERSTQDCQFDSVECLKTDPYAHCRTFGRGTRSCKGEG